MTTNVADRLRAELDGGENIHVFPPKGRAKKPPKTERKLSTIWADEIKLKIDDDVGVIDGLLSKTGLAVLYGESGTAKTFTALDFGCHIAAGRPWRGLAVEQGPVIYIAAESPESVKRRIWAWKQHHGVETLPVLVVQSTVDMLNGDTAALVELVKTVKAEHGHVAMVVIDTLARAMIGNENAPDDMGKFVAACGAIREAGETMVLVVHHTGKDTAKGARGHSCLRAATDVEIEITKGAITVTKSRDDATGRVFGFRLHVVELGTNSKGRRITTCVMLADEAPAKAPELTAKQKVVLDCLGTALADHGEAAPAAHDIPRNAHAVKVEHWLSAVLRYLPDDKPDFRRREGFNRVFEALQAKGLIRHVDGWCWRPSQSIASHRNGSQRDGQ